MQQTTSDGREQRDPPQRPDPAAERGPTSGRRRSSSRSRARSAPRARCRRRPSKGPRCSCRKRTRKPTRHACGASRRLLAAERSQRLRSRSALCTRGCATSRHRLRAPRAPPPARAGHRASSRSPSARSAARTPPAERSSGSPSATQAPPIGTAVCRTPSAKPRWLAVEPVHHRAPARGVDARPQRAREKQQRRERRRTIRRTRPRQRHADAAPRPTPITARSPPAVGRKTPWVERRDRAEVRRGEQHADLGQAQPVAGTKRRGQHGEPEEARRVAGLREGSGSEDDPAVPHPRLRGAPARPAPQLTAAVRAHVLERRRTGRAERALEGADERLALRRRGRVATLADGPQLERHEWLLR